MVVEFIRGSDDATLSSCLDATPARHAVMRLSTPVSESKATVQGITSQMNPTQMISLMESMN
jgi:hypothetical protein